MVRIRRGAVCCDTDPTLVKATDMLTWKAGKLHGVPALDQELQATNDCQEMES